MIVWCVIWLRFDMWPSPSMFLRILIGAAIVGARLMSSAFTELDKQTAWSSSGALWKREVMCMALPLTSLQFLFLYGMEQPKSIQPLLWIGAFALGAGGWFIGDSVRQEVLRRAGSTHP